MPRPVTPSRDPQIVIGGGGKRVLTIAAREADIIGINPNLAPGEVARGGPDARRPSASASSSSGSRTPPVTASTTSRFKCLIFIVQVTDDRKAVIENFAPMFGFTPEEAAEVPLTLIGKN